MEPAEDFAEFLARTANAQPEDYPEAIRAGARNSGLSAAESTAEFHRIKGYILSYYGGVTPVRSFVSSTGQPVDCVPYDQQPAVRAARAAGLSTGPVPVPPTPVAPPGSSSAAPGSPSESGRSLPPGSAGPSTTAVDPPSTSDSAPCPPGTVGLLRMTLDRLVPIGRLDDLFRKSSGPPE